jgi:hypothetical protein
MSNPEKYEEELTVDEIIESFDIAQRGVRRVYPRSLSEPITDENVGRILDERLLERVHEVAEEDRFRPGAYFST